jgi:P27 family predicted phage terminase small subunit
MPERGKRLWTYIVRLLGAYGVLDGTDKTVLELLCRSYAYWKQAALEFEKDPVTPGSKGQPTVSPWYSIMNSEAERLRKLLIEVGLTPASRSKLSGLMAGTSMDDELQSWLEG